MKKGVFIIIITMVTLSTLGISFARVDDIRLKNNKEPLFSFLYAQFKYGGTKEYIGLGYDEIKIGPWFINYDDFNTR